MASTSGSTPDSIIDQLEANPFRFDFFRAVRLLDSHFSSSPRVGRSMAPAQDAVRFYQAPSLAFPSSTLAGVDKNRPNGVPRVLQNFFGVFGPNGPLPPHLTDYAHERELHHDDYTLTSFINLFHHRLVSFFYRAWADNQKSVDLDRPDDQSFAIYIGSFLGIGLDSLRNRDAVHDWAKLYFAGRLAPQTRNAEGLQSILEAFFEIHTEVETFAGRWMNLPADSECRLGETPETGSLGQTTIVGSRIWDCQLGFRVRLGPMSLADYERMLPDKPSFNRLRYWILNYCGEHFTWDAQLVLKAGEVPTTQLGQVGRLGWTTWLKTLPMTRDADDLIVHP